MSWLSLVTTCLLLGIVYGDYACVCSYNEEINVFDQADANGNIIGQMYEFDCKPDAKMVAPQDWIAVLYQHKVGYIQVNSDINNQSCQGAIPDEDKLITTMPVGETTTVMMTTTTTVMETSTSAPEPVTFAPTTEVPTTSAPMTSTTTTSVPMTSAPTTAVPMTPAPTTGAPMMSTTMQPQTTTTTAAMSTTTTMQTQTPAPTTAMPVTTTGMATITGQISLCPTRIQQLGTRSGEILAQYADNCYEVVQRSVSWSHAESICHQHGGHLAHIANQAEQDFIHAFLVKEHSHTVWLGLHDRAAEEKFEWTSGNSIDYTNWMPGRKDFRHHNSEDCVFMTLNGQWDDIQCGGDSPLQELFQGHRHAFICQYATTNAKPLDGDLSMCSKYLQNKAISDGGVLAQHGVNCYEFINNKASWQHAESLCHTRGGHLATITNAEEQAFVLEFMQRHSANHAAWIGLNDRQSEGTFHWSSGEPVQYINWTPNHLDNFDFHTREDCVLFVPYKNGEWDDTDCGRYGFASDFGEVHPLLCKFGLHDTGSGGSFIGK